MKKQVSLLLFIALGWQMQGMTMEKAVTKETTLDNGLKIVVREDHRAPVVVSQVWYKVGSGYESRGITGISHALEHMMFQGTPTLPGDGFSKLVSKYGGRDNAFTSEDYTAYYEELDASQLEVSFQLEADRMSHLLLDKDAFAKEIQVVMEERRLRTDDNPQSVTYERFLAVANPMGPYHHPVIGWKSDLDFMTVEDLRRWYQSWYGPNNATLVVVGDVNAEKVFDLARKHFGPLKPVVFPERKSQQELSPLGEKRIKVHAKANLPFAIWGYPVPSLKTAQNKEEAYALWVANAILSGGDSARFQKELIRGQQVASNLSAHYDLLQTHPTQFVITGVPAQKQTVASLEQKVMAQIERLKTELVPEAELNRVKTQLLAHELFEKDSMAEQAILLGVLETVGLSWQLADEFVSHIKAVKAEDIQAAAKKYFIPQHLTMAELIPEKVSEEGQK